MVRVKKERRKKMRQETDSVTWPQRYFVTDSTLTKGSYWSSYGIESKERTLYSARGGRIMALISSWYPALAMEK
jgi:hypothetical protein